MRSATFAALLGGAAAAAAPHSSSSSSSSSSASSSSSSLSPPPLPSLPYKATVVEFDATPLLSQVGGSSAFAQVFNPSWVEATNLTGGVAGLLIRSQNCTGCGAGYDPVKAPESTAMCCSCAGTGQNASRIAFSKQLAPAATAADGGRGGGGSGGAGAAAPRFAPVTAGSVVFGPRDSSDARGTEDPRLQFDPATNLYYMFYTCWHASGKAQLCLASSSDPTSATAAAWTRHGLVFGEVESKSAALVPPALRRQGAGGARGNSHGGGNGGNGGDGGDGGDGGVYSLIHGAGKISYTESTDPLSWPHFGEDFITNVTWAAGGGNANVEAGPPPMRLSDGNLVFFFNSWCGDEHACPQDVPPPGYQPVWAVLNGSNPGHILAKANAPLWSPMDQPWMSGASPYTCNVPQVSFLEAAHPEGDDRFRVFFGGADAVIGSAVVEISATDTGAQ